MGYEVILSFWPQKENSPHSRGLTLTQAWPLTLIFTLGTYNIYQLSPYRITADIDKPHSNKHQETPWVEKNWKTSYIWTFPPNFPTCCVAQKIFLGSIFVTPCFWFCTYLESLADLFSVCVCVHVCVQLCCEIYTLLCPLLCHLQYGGQVPHTHSYTHTHPELKWKPLQVR